MIFLKKLKYIYQNSSLLVNDLKSQTEYDLDRDVIKRIYLPPNVTSWIQQIDVTLPKIL